MATKTLRTSHLMFFSVDRSNRFGLVATCLLLLIGCSTVPDKIELLPPSANAGSQIDLRDARSLEQLAGKRWETSTSVSVTFGDDQFSPTRLVVLKRGLEQEIGAPLQGKTILLKDFEVSSMHSYSFIQGAPGAGSPFAHALETLRADRNLRSKIVVSVDGGDVEATAWTTVSIANQKDGLRTVVAESIAKLIQQLRERLGISK